MKNINLQLFGIAFGCVATLVGGTLLGQYQSQPYRQVYQAPANQPHQYPNYQQNYQGQVYGQPGVQNPVYPNQTYPNTQRYQQTYPQYGQPGITTQQTLTTSHWAQTLKFGDRKHDFGVVPTASKQVHVFEFENTLAEEIFLTGVRTSCGCTKPKILTTTVKPGEIAKILAKFDTLSFRGQKAATVTVSIRKHVPYVEYGEVQFSVKGKIRQDVVLNPGKIVFDNVRNNEQVQRSIEVKYAGDPRWALVEAKSSNPNLLVESREANRDLTTGRVTYELIVKLLSDQPIGMFTDQITLITNDFNQASRKMAVHVEGNVQAVIQSSPIKLGAITKDATVKKKLVVRGQQAFRIKEILVDNQRISIDKAEGEKSLHILDYELDTSIVGPVSGEITVVADLPGEPMAKITFDAQIVQPVATQK